MSPRSPLNTPRKIGRWLWGHDLPAWLGFFVVWQLLSLILSLPSPSRIVALVVSNLTNADFLVTLGGSLVRMGVGYTGVMILGIGLGLLVGRVRWLDNILGTLAAALNAMPGAAWVPLSVILLGLNERAVIFTVVLGATGVVMQSTSSGVKGVPPLILRAARSMGARGIQLFWNVVIPAAIPRIVDGLRLAWAFAWRALMAGELLIGSVRGMGQLINEVAKQRDIEQLLALMAIIILIGMAVEGIFFNRLIGDRIRTRWGTA